MLTVTAICDLYSFLYADIPTPQGTFDHVIPLDGSYTAIKRIDGIDYVMFRGSTTFLDWIEDFDNFAIPYPDPILGDIHPGARLGVLAVKDQIDALIGPNIVIVGHSLGAMHAAIYAGYKTAEGKHPVSLVMFGEPRAGGPQLSKILSSVHVQSFRNAAPANPPGSPISHDLVTDVPRALPPDLPYQHIRDPLTDCYREPAADDLWLLFKWHHFRLYAESMGAAGPAVLSLPSPGVGAP